MTKQKIYGIIGGNTLATSFGFDEESENFGRFKVFAQSFLKQLGGDFITCANGGLELFCGEFAIENRQNVVCVMPFEEQATKWSGDLRERFFNLHEKSAGVKILSKKHFYGCEEKAEEYVADNCDCVILVKSKGDEVSENVKSAIKQKDSVIVLDCDDYTIKYEV